MSLGQPGAIPQSLTELAGEGGLVHRRGMHCRRHESQLHPDRHRLTKPGCQHIAVTKRLRVELEGVGGVFVE